jgi:hypothetical protein
MVDCPVGWIIAAMKCVLEISQVNRVAKKAAWKKGRAEQTRRAGLLANSALAGFTRPGPPAEVEM